MGSHVMVHCILGSGCLYLGCTTLFTLIYSSHEHTATANKPTEKGGGGVTKPSMVITLDMKKGCVEA